MINSVTGPIENSDLGFTLIHEHILWAWVDDVRELNPPEKVIEIMLPFLYEVKELGVKTIVEPTTEGAGRDADLLASISKISGINIITNCGVWDGLDYRGIFVPKELYEMSSQDIANLWISEFENGIGNTDIKPGFIKLAIGDGGYLNDFNLKVLNAAIICSRQTGLSIQAHMISFKSARHAVEILEENNFPLNKFMWAHADYAFRDDVIIELARKGIWIETDWNTAKPIDLTWYVDLILKMKNENLINQLLISQDVGGFHNGNISPYNRLFTNFIPYCKNMGIEQSVIDKIFIENPPKALNINSIT